MWKLAIVFLVVIGFCGLSIYGLLNFGDGFIEVTGTVCEWADAPAGTASGVYWEGELPEGAKLMPLEGATVTIFHARDHAKEPIKESNEFRDDAVTDESGTFSTSGTTNPRSHHAVLRVTREGFASVEVKFLHPNEERKGGNGRFSHSATVLLVRQP